MLRDPAYRGKQRGAVRPDYPDLDLHTVGADVLGDAASLAGGHFRGANRIEQGSLAVIDVAHDGDYRRARQLNVVRIRGNQFFKFFFSHHLLKRNEGDFVTKALAEFDRDVVVERLIDGGENAALQAAGSPHLWV